MNLRRLLTVVAALLVGTASSCGGAQREARYIFRGAQVVSVLLPLRSGTRTRVTQGFQGYLSHNGSERFAVDLSLPEGTPVLAGRGGRVLAVKDDSQRGCAQDSCVNLANYVAIDHGDGTIGHYYHLLYRSVMVKAGDAVCPGQQIALSGNTGKSTGPHLHFAVDDLFGRSLPLSFRELNNTPHGVLYPNAIVTSTTRAQTRCATPYRYSKCGEYTFLHTGIVLARPFICAAIEPNRIYSIRGRSLTKGGWVYAAIYLQPSVKWLDRCVRTDREGNFTVHLSWDGTLHGTYSYLMLTNAEKKCQSYGGWSTSLKVWLVKGASR